MFEKPPVLAISSTSITRYYEHSEKRKKTLKSLKSQENLTRGVFKGSISFATRKILRKRLSEYYDSMYAVGQYYRKKKEIVHPIVTLTLPSRQKHGDNELKAQCLAKIIDLMKSKYDIRFYYWIAEKQQNDNIHFHMLTDRFIEHEWLRKAWNQRLEGLGYIDEFERKFGHRNPNSTDIHAIKNLARSSDYVTKYTSKADQQGGIEGRLHGGSDLLRKIDRYKPYSFHEFDMKLSEWIDNNEVRLFECDHAIALYGNIRNLMKRDCPKHFKEWQEHHREIANMFYN